MKVEVLADADAVAQAAAGIIAADARTAVAARGRSVVAVIGNATREWCTAARTSA